MERDGWRDGGLGGVLLGLQLVEVLILLILLLSVAGRLDGAWMLTRK